MNHHEQSLSAQKSQRLQARNNRLLELVVTCIGIGGTLMLLSIIAWAVYLKNNP